MNTASFLAIYRSAADTPRLEQGTSWFGERGGQRPNPDVGRRKPAVLPASCILSFTPTQVMRATAIFLAITKILCEKEKARQNNSERRFQSGSLNINIILTSSSKSNMHRLVEEKPA